MNKFEQLELVSCEHIGKPGKFCEGLPNQ